ncbi:MAG TPA: hypothetical protein VKZ53_22260 [Candidatus Angelobacter sp.]|nr:hypothetical protein [Candidatus Angelobacter sp.]
MHTHPPQEESESVESLVEILSNGSQEKNALERHYRYPQYVVD